jgi:hypothetical protein
MASSLIVTLSKNIARPWELMRNFRQCTTHSPTEQLKGQWPDFFGNQKMLVRPKEG